MGAKLFENFLGTLRWTLDKPCRDLVQTLRSTLSKCWLAPQIVVDTCVLTSYPQKQVKETKPLYLTTYITVLMIFFLKICVQFINHFCDGDEIVPCDM